jgi:acetyl-CoA carboxylase beta subunit
MTWDPELTELAHRKALAAELGGPERVARQHATGRLTVRERIDALLDAGSWQETGSVAGTAAYDDDGALSGFTPASAVTGTGRLDGRRVVVSADDFTIKGGAANPMLVGKAVDAERRALAERVPVVRLLDGTGGGGTVESLEEFGRTYVPYNPGWDSLVAQLAAVPVVTAALGPVAGLGAVRLVTSHVSVMVRELSQVFVAGPAVVEAGMGERLDKEQLGGWQVAARAGTVDLVADTSRRPSTWCGRCCRTCRAACGSGRRSCPATTRRTGATTRCARWCRARAARPTTCAPCCAAPSTPARCSSSGGCTRRPPSPRWPASAAGRWRCWQSDPRVYGGGLTAAGSDKLARFVDLADTFGLPVVHLVDQPGFVLGSASEAAAVVRHGARALAAVEQSRVPVGLGARAAVLRCGRRGPPAAGPLVLPGRLALGRLGVAADRGRAGGGLQAAAGDQPRRRRAQGRDRRPAGGGALPVPHRRGVPRRGGRRPRRHPPAAVRLGAAGARGARDHATRPARRRDAALAADAVTSPAPWCWGCSEERP